MQSPPNRPLHPQNDISRYFIKMSRKIESVYRIMILSKWFYSNRIGQIFVQNIVITCFYFKRNIMTDNDRSWFDSCRNGRQRTARQKYPVPCGTRFLF